LGYVLTAGIEEAYVASFRYLDFMQLVAERIGVEYTDIKYLLSKEIYRALMYEEKIENSLIEERKKGFIMCIVDGEQYFAVGAEAHEMSLWIDTELSKVDKSITELRGQTACKGLVRGRVRIALSPNEAHTLLSGEILVCPMTNPDYVPAMQRSSAIITDEGGLLSHAAIMSREFGKPCVIATKIATRLLKDGDLVEVDANKGLVRILEKYV
jgi:phosphoenolpyruvate synthase/pyruvate phosphate dikinase